MRLSWAGVNAPTLRFASAILAAALLSGCHVLGTGASGSGSVTVGVVPVIDNAPLDVAVKGGLFQQHGLQVTVKDYPSLDAELQALTGGQVQVAAGDYTGFLYYQQELKAKAHPLRLLADGYDAASDSVAILALPPGPGKPAITAKDLQGVSAGVATAPGVIPGSATKTAAKSTSTSPYNWPTLAAMEVLQNQGVSPSSVTWKTYQPKDMIGALASGQVKAILATEPYILQAQEKLGAVEVANASTGATSGLPMSGYFSLASYAQANSSAVQAFQDGLSQAQAECAQRGPVQSVLPGLAGMASGDASLVTLGTYPQSLNVGQVQRVATLMYDSGMISAPENVGTLTAGVTP
jgi:NitT/TauT family transport system substrate-binding protein